MLIRTDYAFRQLNLHKLSSGTFADNEPSKRALLKAGYREVGVEREHFFPRGSVARPLDLRAPARGVGAAASALTPERDRVPDSLTTDDAMVRET